MRKFLLLILLILPSLLFAQSATITGRVISSSDTTSLIGAMVLINGGEKLNALCNEKGEFIIHGSPTGKIHIEISFMGFNTYIAELDLKSGINKLESIILTEKASEIDAVVVKGNPPMSIQKGDTTQFNAGAFKTQPDADSEQLIAKMPGVIVQEGKVEAQGEPIRRIYVDGKLFFGNDVSAALKNLPADAVESIQIFDEQSEQSKASGYDDGNTTKSLNIITKTKTKESTLGRFEGSYGADDRSPYGKRYLTGGNFSRFTETQRITLTGLMNNVNVSRFGTPDITGASAANGEDRDRNGNITNQINGIKEVIGTGLNYSLNKEKIEFSGDYFYDNNKNDFTRRNSVEYYPNPPKYNTRSSSGSSASSIMNHNHRASFRLQYRPNRKNTILIEPRVTYQRIFNATDGMGLTLQDGDSLNRNRTVSQNNNDNFSLSGYAFWTHRFNKSGRTFTLNISAYISSRESDRYQTDIYRDNYNLKKQAWIPTSNPLDRLISQDVTSNNVKAKITYTEPFAKYHRIVFSASSTYDWGLSDKGAWRFDKQLNNYSIVDSNQFNKFDRNYIYTGGGIGYAYGRKGIYTNVGVEYQTVQQRSEEFNPKNIKGSFKFNDIQPIFSLRYNLEKRKFLRINYSGRSVLPRAEQMQNSIDDSSPSNIRVGNPKLRQGYQHQMTLFYNAANTQKSTNFNVSLYLQTISNYIASSVSTFPTDRDTVLADYDNYVPQRGAFMTRYTNLNGYKVIRLNTTYSFTVKPIKSNVNVTLGYNFFRTPSFYKELNYANTNAIDLKLGITSNISQNVDFNIYSVSSINDTKNSAKDDSRYFAESLYSSINIIFLKRFVFNTLFTWRYNESTGIQDIKNSYYILNIGIGRKFFRRNNGEFRITVYDLLNQNKNLLHYVRDTYVEEASTNTLGRYAMARFIFHFNTMSAQAYKISQNKNNQSNVQKATAPQKGTQTQKSTKPANNNQQNKNTQLQTQKPTR